MEWRPRPESNRNRRFRKPELYPFELRGHTWVQAVRDFAQCGSSHYSHALTSVSKLTSGAVREDHWDASPGTDSTGIRRRPDRFSRAFCGAKRRACRMSRLRSDGRGDPRELALARVGPAQRRIGTAEAVPFHTSAQSFGFCTCKPHPPHVPLYSNSRNALASALWGTGIYGRSLSPRTPGSGTLRTQQVLGLFLSGESGQQQ